MINEYAIQDIINRILKDIPLVEWQQKINYYRLYGLLFKYRLSYVKKSLPKFINILKDSIYDTRKLVKLQAIDTLKSIFNSISNLDIIPILPNILNAYIDPIINNNITIDKLYATTFVSEIDTICLSLIITILLRSLKEKNSVYKRRSVVILDNICKLVANYEDAILFYPTIEKFFE